VLFAQQPERWVTYILHGRKKQRKIGQVYVRNIHGNEWAKVVIDNVLVFTGYNLLNTLEAGVHLIEKENLRTVKLLADLFHMNIEKSPFLINKKIPPTWWDSGFFRLKLSGADLLMCHSDRLKG
jgi:tmRNA-binding protein